MPHNLLLTRDNPVVLVTRDATPRPRTFNAQARTVEAVIASATPVPRQDQRGAFHEILDPAGLDIAGSRGASVLDSHNRSGLDAVLGTLDDIRIDGDQVIGTIRFSSRPEIDPIVADVRSGVIQHLSVGYEVSEWREGTVGGTGGGTGGGGIRTRTAIKWTIREASFVSVPADRTARTRSEPVRTTNRQIRDLCIPRRHHARASRRLARSRARSRRGSGRVTRSYDPPGKRRHSNGTQHDHARQPASLHSRGR